MLTIARAAARLHFTYDPNHKYTHYTLDGIKYYDGGQHAEMQTKAALGLKPEIDGNGRFDKVSDIPEYNASVKSSHATLTEVYLGADLAECINNYFEQVVSTAFWFVNIENGELTIYKMDATTFRKFLEKFGRYEKGRKVVRITKWSTKMLAWFKYDAE